MNNSRKTVLFIAMSLDGYIAGSNNDLSFLDEFNSGEDYGYDEFMLSIDTVISGFNTYAWVKKSVGEYPHRNKTNYIITSKRLPNKKNIIFYNDDIKALILKLKKKKGKNIYIEGGAQIVNIMLQHQLLDEIYLFIAPVLLGSGIKLFNNNYPPDKFKLRQNKAYNSGMVLLRYSK